MAPCADCERSTVRDKAVGQSLGSAHVAQDIILFDWSMAHDKRDNLKMSICRHGRQAFRLAITFVGFSVVWGGLPNG